MNKEIDIKNSWLSPIPFEEVNNINWIETLPLDVWEDVVEINPLKEGEK